MPDASSSKLVPYAGLRPFRIDEDYLFFGREEQTAELVRLLREHRFLAVVGRSGSGKSSLVRAGLLPEIQGGMMQHAGSAWEIAVLRPGGHPIRNLAESLIDADLYDGEDEEAVLRILATLNHSALGLVESFRQSEIEKDANLLIVVDQFEELFRFGQHDSAAQDEAHAFVELLLEASRSREVSIYVVLTMRSDYLGDCSNVPGLAEAVNRGEYLIPGLERPQLRAAIEGPAKVGGSAISYRLVQHLLNELGDEEDLLPILQHALMRTWTFWETDHEDGEEIDLRHYEGIGGMQLAISNHADEIFDSLPGHRHRQVTESLFRTLTVKGEDNRGVRRPTKLGDLAAIAGEEIDILIPAIDAYRRQGVTFLMPGEDTKLEEDTVIDLSHESLMRVWQSLRRWVDTEAQSARIYRRLVDTANLWKEEKAGLYHNPDLDIALTWRSEEGPNLAWAEQYGAGFHIAVAFLEQSEESAKRAEREAEAARQRDLKQAQELAESRARSAKLLKRFAVTVGAAFILATALAILAIQKSNKAEEQSELALQQTEIAREAEDKARTAASVAQYAQGRTWLANAQTLAESKDGFSARLKAMRALGFEGAGRENLTEAQQEQYPVLLQRGKPGWNEARTLVNANSDANLLWQNGSLPQHSGLLNSVAVSPDGKLIASASEGEDELVRIWDGVTGETVTTLDASLLDDNEALAFSPRGDYLALAADDEVAFWRIENRRFTLVSETPFTATPQTQGMGEGGEENGQTASRNPVDFRSLAFSPDGKTLALGDDLGRVYVWRNWNTFKDFPDTPVQKELSNVPGQLPDSRVADLEFQPGSGGLLAYVSGNDCMIHLFDVNTFERKGSLAAPETFVRGDQVARLWSISFSNDGKYLAAGGAHLPVNIWNITSQEVETTLLHEEWERVQGESKGDAGNPPKLGFECHSVSFSADGRRLAAGWQQSGTAWDPRWYPGTVSIFDSSGGISSMPRLKDVPIDDHRTSRTERNLRQVNLIPGGERLLISHADTSRIQLWDLEKNEPVLRGTGSHSGQIQVIRFSRAGTLFATGDEHGVVKIWEARTGTLRHSIRAHLSRITDLCFSADGGKLFSISQKDKNLSAWDTETGENLHTISQSWPTIGLGLTPDGKSLLLGGWTSKFQLYDANTLEKRGVLELAHGNRLKFSPDGEQLVIYRNPGMGSVMTIYQLEEGVSLGKSIAFPDSLPGSRIEDVEYSPDALTMAIAFHSGVVKTWSRQADGAWNESLSLKMPDNASDARVKFDASGERLFAGDSSGKISIWNASTGELLNTLPGPDGISDLALSPDGQLLITGSEHGILQIWSVSHGSDSFHEIANIGNQDGHWFTKGSTSVTLARERRLLFTTGRKTNPNAVQAWRIQRGKLSPAFELKGHTAPPKILVLSKDERYLAASSSGENGDVILWDLDTRKHTTLCKGVGLSRLAFSPDGKTLASRDFALDGGGDPRPVNFWDTGLENQRQPLTKTILLVHNTHGMAFTPDGKQFIVTAFEKGEPIRVFDFDPQTRETKLRAELGAHNERFTGVDVSTDGRFLSACSVNGKEAKLWDLTTHTVLGNIPDTKQWNFSTAISPDNRFVAYAGGNSRVKVYRTDGSGELVAQYQGPAQNVFQFVPDLTFDTDGRILIMSLSDGRVVVWLLPLVTSQVDPGPYLEVVDLEEASGKLQWQVRNNRLSPPASSRNFSKIEERYLPFLEGLDSPLERNKALFAHYLELELFPSAESVLQSLDPEDAEALWKELSSALAEELMRAKASGETIGTGPLRRLALEVFDQHPPGLDVQLGLLIERADWARLSTLLKEKFPSLPLEERATHVEALFQSLDTYLQGLSPRVDTLPEDDGVIPPRDLLLASTLYQAATEFRKAWDADPWKADSISNDLPPAAIFLNQLDARTRQTLLPAGETWKYYANPGAPEGDWKEGSYDERSGWKAGASPIGYGTLTGVVDYGTRLNSFKTKDTGQLSYYFRKEIEIPSDWQGSLQQVSGSLLRDDGLILYLDGVEVLRLNMPAGEVTPDTLASSVINEERKEVWVDFTLPPRRLEPGSHVLAAEVHQFNDTSSDILFDLALYTPSGETWRSADSLSKAIKFLTGIDPKQDLFPWLPALTDDITVGFPDEVFHRALKTRVLVSVREVKKALEIADRRISELQKEYSPPRVGEKKLWLSWKAKMLQTRGGSASEIEAARQAFLAIPPRDPNLATKVIDLTNYYVRGFYQGPNQTAIPDTFTSLSGVDYDLRGVIELNSGPLDDGKDVASHRTGYHLPEKVEGIVIGQKAPAIHFLLNAYHCREDKRVEVGKLIMHYEDGTKAERPLIATEDVADWWETDDRPRLAEEKIAWRNPRGKPPTSLAELTWKNPHPEKTIKTIDFVSSLKKAAPFLVGITLD